MRPVRTFSSPADWRRAFGQFATGVTIFTPRDSDGHPVGITANSFTSVSLEPATVLFCVGRQRRSLEALARAERVAINVLAADQHDLCRRFATPAADKFGGVAHHRGPHNLPLIDGAIARFVCQATETIDHADHVIFVCEVESHEIAEGTPLIFHAGAYHVTKPHPEIQP